MKPDAKDVDVPVTKEVRALAEKALFKCLARYMTSDDKTFSANPEMRRLDFANDIAEWLGKDIICGDLDLETAFRVIAFLKKTFITAKPEIIVEVTANEEDR